MPDAAIAEVFITDELARRAAGKVDYFQEKLALQDLAARMADRPDEVLPRFVDLAMEMTGGVSAGLSLYEEDPAPGVFRWQYLRGLLAPFNGATTPRNFSPCGITLDRNGPVLSSHPERVYNWISEANIVVPEVLLVPLYLGGKAPLGTLWIVSDKEGHFDSGHARVMTELASFVGIALRMLQSEQRLQRSLDEQQTLAMEMGHRVKNLFAMIDGMVRISAKDTTSKDDLARVLSGRVHALADAHALVRRNFGAGDAARATDLVALVRTILRPYERRTDDAASRFAVQGPAIMCGDQATNGMALVLHELATNAAKYGALKAADGRVEVTWLAEGANVVLRWIERDGPRIESSPDVSGFGSALAQTMIVKQFGGSLDYDWRPSGLAVRISVPLESLSN